MPITGITPIFISGAYRSGTTILSRMLDAHPKLAVTYDSVHFMRFIYGEFSPIGEKRNYEAAVEDMRQRCEARWERKLDMAPVLTRLGSIGKPSYEEVYDTVMRHLLLGEGKESWGEKTIVAWSKIPVFLEMFPQGKAIQIIRDPRDVLASNKGMTYEKGLRYLDAAFACLSSMRAAIKYERSLPAQSYITVRYEDLAREPEKTSMRLCKMLGVEYDSRMIDGRFLKDYKGQTWVKNTSYAGLSNAISTESLGKYREALDSVEIAFTEMVSRTGMDYFNYEFDGKVLARGEWDKLHEILNDEFISGRYQRWLKTNDGVEAYPSKPPRVLRDGPSEEKQGEG
ncbi:MAG: hypothetical protein A2X49_04125 [Lentisphaerae bacterium GWF2_52_8]|nr:MAG: hypothetical protein A2X49_04125 [Lentisphaerae bacterium GWF2_52_8]